MHGLVQLFQGLVTALAAACLAHFGLALKSPPAPKADSAVVQRVPAATPAHPAPAAAGLERAKPV